jgi:DNA-binding response OmpR family regulator
MSLRWTIIYCDDQIQNIEVYKELLEENFNVIGCQDANKCSGMLKDFHPHAFLLDVHMPSKGGLDVYKEIIENPLYNGCPVFFISGDISDETRIRALESGAVDFISREIRVDELILRLSNKIKMYLNVSTVLELGNLRIDVRSLRTTIDNENVDLTLLEMRILGFLLRAFPQSISKDEVKKKIWGKEPVKDGTINTHLTNLRPKISNWTYSVKTRESQVFVQPKA